MDLGYDFRQVVERILFIIVRASDKQGGRLGGSQNQQRDRAGDRMTACLALHFYEILEVRQ
ncbi:MAG: hypothetical protein OXH40_14885 [Chloroflexi bacterium]|nr:hypothetical protein [Chloroflexota bacterium]MCY3684600.1 hypothetical protein [Chloroflexota bacterium]MDE2710004.1 hypothetical protein [Chloroflexota bacterium]